MLYFSAVPVWGWLALVLSVGLARLPYDVTDPVCVTQADTVRPHLEKFQWIVTNSTPANLSGLDLPPNPTAGAVTVVTDEAICSQAVTAYNGQLVGSDTSLAVTRIIVLRVGANRFVVTRASSPTGPGWRSWSIYNSSFQFLGAIAGS
jgi:hypothetical protein